MSEDIFDALRSELTSEADPSGVPESALFWDEAFTYIAEAYSIGAVPGTSHLEMADASETTGTGSLLVSPSVRPLVSVAAEDDGEPPLVGRTTRRDLSVAPLTMQIQSHDKAYSISAWIAVTRGGQRWARLGAGENRQLVNLQEPEYPEGLEAVGEALEFASRVQQRHMGLEIPIPEFTPLDLVTAIAISQAAQLSAPSLDGEDSYVSSAWRALQTQTIMRVASLRALLNVSHIFADGQFPVDALVRLDSLSDRLGHLGCGRPEHSSRILSPGATETLREALMLLRGVAWDDVSAVDLQVVTGMSAEEALWWGPRGIALVCLQRTGGVGRVWSDLSSHVGPFLGSLVRDAERTGLAGPLSS